MAKAKRESTTRLSTNNKKPVTVLIDAHWKAVNRARAINGALDRLPQFSMPGVPIPEIGGAVAAHSKDELASIIAGHLARNGLDGWAAIEFRGRMKPVATAVEALEAVNQQWRERNRIEKQEAEQEAANREETKAWAALVKHVKANPQDASAIARYLVDESIHGGPMPAWKQSQFLEALAKGGAR